MPFSPRLPVMAVTLAVALSGCVAVPLAQLAMSQMAPTKPACPGCTADTAMTAFSTISQGVSDSFNKMTGVAPDTKKAAGGIAAK